MVRTAAAGVWPESLPVSGVYLAEPCHALFYETVTETVVHVFLFTGMAHEGAAGFYGDTEMISGSQGLISLRRVPAA